MTSELNYLVLVTLLTALCWVPYILNPKPHSPWAERLKAAHANGVENLVVFAPLVLAAHVAGVSNDTTVLACATFFWARVAYLFAYTFAVPWVRTLTFAVGFVCILALGIQLLVVGG
jgi:uncharacterized MAPEG superfamily protein